LKVDNKSVEYDNSFRYFRTLTDEESPAGNEHLKLQRKYEFLREVVNDGLFNGLLTLGPKGFDKFLMEHTGSAWIIRMEAEVPK
jgi:hypothetical protein